MTTFFEAPPSDKAALEEGKILTPRFDSAGLVTAVVADAADSEILMLAHMNAQALQLTIETGTAHYWSRSRNSLWKKGETSGNLQMVEDIRVDCDQDAILLKVRVTGADATCHTGRRSCFYRKVDLHNGTPSLVTIAQPLFDPTAVYGKK